MGESEQEQREAVVTEALSWVGTPYVLGGHVKKAGCDCASFISEVLINSGLASRDAFADVGIYSHDWYFHAQSERYLKQLLRHAKRVIEAVAYRNVKEAKPGDIVVTRTMKSHRFNHGGVVIAWPQIVHAVDPKVELTDASGHYLWSCRKIEIYSPFVT